MYRRNMNYRNDQYNPNMNSRYQAPFDVPRLRTPLGSIKKAGLLGATRKLNLSSIIDNSSKAINTFNQVIPLYREVKPIFQNTKSFAQTLKQAFIKPKKREAKVSQEVIEPEVLDGPLLKKKKEKVDEDKPIVDEKEPHQPFF